jgi:hypothetical protein
MLKQQHESQRTITATEMRLAALDDLVQNLGREVEQRGLSEEELLAGLEKTKHKVFEERYGRPAQETACIC